MRVVRWVVSAVAMSTFALACGSSSTESPNPENGGGGQSSGGGGGSASGGSGGTSSEWETATLSSCRVKSLAGQTVLRGPASMGGSCVHTASIEFSFTSAGELAAVDGVSCDFTPISVAMKYPSCEQYFLCGSCRYFVHGSLGKWLVTPIDDGCAGDTHCDYHVASQLSGGTGGSSGCPSGCKNPYGSNCCQPPYCAGSCSTSPCCN